MGTTALLSSPYLKETTDSQPCKIGPASMELGENSEVELGNFNYFPHLGELIARSNSSC